MLKDFGKLLNNKITFFVPYYQRGYKWEKEHVITLLNDLHQFYKNFINSNSYKYYSMQPLAIKFNKNKNVITLVDGQQRLTTLYIIIKIFEDILGEINNNIFNIIYDREGSEDFIKNITKINKERAEENSDYWHMYNASISIKEWVNGNNYLNKKINKEELREFLYFIKLGETIKFIWYEIPDTENEFEVFTRLNIGKVKLTNSELIKSYIISLIDPEKEEKRFEISKEWDDIEYKLQDNEFYGFISNEELKNRIEIIFQIFLKTKNYKNYELYENLIKKFENEYEPFYNSVEEAAVEMWKDIKNIFEIIRFWHQDREFYHLIGFLTSMRKIIRFQDQ
jgi:uncharacterized protein with ParB-like and HNH nuclease domain